MLNEKDKNFITAIASMIIAFILVSSAYNLRDIEPEGFWIFTASTIVFIIMTIYYYKKSK